MPPRRRSVRVSLPTPANSTTSSTPIVSASKSSFERSNGLITPSSLTDGDDELVKEEMMEVKSEDIKPKGRKRKSGAVSDTDSPFSLSPAPSASSQDPDKRYVLESVNIPRRSKLATEKTTSADNLTLGSPPAKLARSSSALGKSDPIDEEEDEKFDLISAAKPMRNVTGKSKAAPVQPFNIGKHSAVSKSDVASLALESDEEKPLAKGRSAKGKGRSKTKAKAVSPDPLDDMELDADYAMGSDDEDNQLKIALKLSTEVDESSPASSSRATSVSRGKGRGGAKGRVNMRKAAASAASQRVRTAQRQATPESIDASPDDSVSDFGGSDITPLSALDDSESEAVESEESGDAWSDDSDAGPKRKKAKKTKGKWKGKGRRLDGVVDLSDPNTPIDLDGMDEETRTATIQKINQKRREDWKKAEEERKPIKDKQKKLKKQLGRKLTNGEKNFVALSHHHPDLENVWGDLQTKIKPIVPVTMEAHPSLKLTLLPFQKESLYWMKKQEEGPWKGGMLADEMGMGKTIQTIALLLSEPRRKPSLVVAPVVALMQWKNEIETHAEGFTVTLWHGQGRMKAEALKKYDVVLVSYGTLEAAFRRQQRGFKKGNVLVTEKSQMHCFEWHRVILDEAHNIKERSTNAAKAAFALQAKYKWCLSGTPLQNRVGELYSLVRFLGADPFSHYFCKRCKCKSLHWQFSNKRTCDDCGHKPMDHTCFWNTEILTPIARYGIEEGGPGHTAFKKLKILLDRMMLRRTKLERADDLGLPPRIIVVRRDYFSPEEKELYMSLFTGAKRTFATYVDQGTVLNNYSNIFSLITRMRQMACHPDLVLRSKNSAVIKNEPEGTVCRICNDTAEDAIMSSCKHVFDRECIRQYLEVQQMRGHRPECPVCHIEISIDLEAEALDLEENTKKARQGILSRLNLDNWRSSSKLEALVEELEKLRNKDWTIKSLVFSQFVSFLDLIAFRLQRAGFNICRLEGGMTPQQRDATIQHFMKNTHVTVFLISLKAGGVALNLTEASMVFMMDSWWNPSVEYQAMDRIHRLGQKRPVKVVKLVVEDSIEDQIVQLQHKKLAMTEAALSSDPDAALGKLTVEDLGFLFKM
ncbi:SNF2 family N-terminal domain-domain-containing protein [Naematelia encephala]|uniref:SNF2 family N-terminal domain-domain-containing protein n=1 Tax=Naematelia encephala TaxID=71784 RepID=A0A1Y2BK75_9TREE|nr:SNF2 family N-terminal domain-domain-containing protein [Naematelia encephala]